MSKVNVGTRGHIDWGNPNAMRLSADTKKFISDRLIKEPKMNSEIERDVARDFLDNLMGEYDFTLPAKAYCILRAALSTEAQQPADTVTLGREELSDEQIDRMLSARVAGGSEARAWFLPHDTAKGLANVRDVIRRMFERSRTGKDE